MSRSYRRFSFTKLLSTFLIVVLIAPLIPRAARADAPSTDATGQSGIADATISLPESGAGIANGSVLTSVDTSTGTARTSIPFKLSTARGHAQPQLGLSYSATTGAGTGGWGWSLTVPTIERAPLAGPPGYRDPARYSAPNGDEDRFTFDGKALVPICFIPDKRCSVSAGVPTFNSSERLPKFAASGGWTYYRLETDGSDIRLFWSGTHETWVVQYQNGVTMEFGQPLGSDSSNGNAIVPFAYEVDVASNNLFRWNLVRQYDTEVTQSGVPVNRVLYQWAPKPGDAHLYLTDVFDTLGVGAAGQYPTSAKDFAHHVHLEYEDTWPAHQQPQNHFVSPVWRASPQYVVSRVDISAVSDTTSQTGNVSARRLVRRYAFTHAEPDSAEYSNRSLLLTMQMEGRCVGSPGVDLEGSDFTISPDTNCTFLPQTTFDYTAYFPDLSPHTLVDFGSGNASDVQNTQYLFDMNADGIADLVQSPNAPGSSVGVVSGDRVKKLPLNITYPPGFLRAINPNYPPDTYWNNNNRPSPGDWIAGNFLGDGQLNQLVPSALIGSVDHSVFPFAAMTPSINGPTASLTGVTTPKLIFWQASPTRTPDNKYYTYAESIFAVVDVDGDGYLDALTDTPVANVVGSGGGAPLAHFLSVRTTTRDSAGTLTPFAVPGKDLGDHAVLGASSPVLPTNGQYSAKLVPGTDDNSYPLFGTGLFGSPGAIIGQSTGGIVFFEDMNGDGISDWVSLSAAGGSLGYWPGHGDGTFGSCATGDNACKGSDRFTGVNARTLYSRVPAFADGSQVYLHDVTADGLPDLVVAIGGACAATDTCDGGPQSKASIMVYINQHGTGFDSGNALIVPNWLADTSQIVFGDVNGSGNDDLVVIQGTDGNGVAVRYFDLLGGQPTDLLSNISNGYGANTRIEYSSTTELARAASATGPLTAWQRSTPQIIHPVVKITSANGLRRSGTSTPSPIAETRIFEYSYKDPVYDPRDRAFVGFQQVSVKADGDSDEPSATTRTTFLSGICEVDQTGPGKCPPPSPDRPFLALRGKPVLVETYDDNGHWHTTVHTAYRVESIAPGFNGESARFAYPATVDTWLYDSSAVASGYANATSLADATFDNGIGDALRNIPLAVGVPVNQVETTQELDAYGHQTKMADRGRPGDDQPIQTITTWDLRSDDPTSWQWRPKTQHLAAFALPALAPADRDQDAAFEYYPDGLVRTVTRVLHGAGVLVRARNGTASPTAPKASTEGETINTANLIYDAYGNLKYRYGPNTVTCELTQYDASFMQLATTHQSFANSCDSPASIVTSQSWDRGLETVTMSVDPDGATTTYAYDSFGRLTSSTKPDQFTGGPVMSPSLVVTFHDYSEKQSIAGQAFQRVDVAMFDGTAQRLGYVYKDAWGQLLVTVGQADAGSYDLGDWVVSGGTVSSARGTVVREYEPAWTPTGANFPVGDGLSNPYKRSVYDAFGQVTATFDIDGTQTSRHTYHSLAEDVLDAEQLAGSHVGAFSKSQLDGHGRIIRTTHVQTNPSADEVSVDTVYTATGNPGLIAQSHSVDPSKAVVRTFGYDSFGRLVSNVEPNASYSGVGWRYAYDDDGNLVGTSDARGCGKNMVYDPLGRLRWEDYWPCTQSQASYSPAPPPFSRQFAATVTGVETFYVYDTESTQWATAGTLLSGRVLDVYDRAAHTSFSYDGRGRTTSISRQLARPDASSITPLASNYSTKTFTTVAAYDNADRLVSQSTGADDFGELLGTDIWGDGSVASRSLLTAQYSARGALASVQGSYGTIIQANAVDADGAARTTVYGDGASTTAYQCYDGRKRLVEFALLRGTDSPKCGHRITPPNLAQVDHRILADTTYQLDGVGNPLSLNDNRRSDEWIDGSMPVDRNGLTYDDEYRLTGISYSYKTANFTDAFHAPVAATTTYQNPLSVAYPSTKTRVQSQSYAYDWLGNTIQSKDDQSVFFDRSLGDVTNGIVTQGSPGAFPYGPNQLVTASSVSPASQLSTDYDQAGNLVSLWITQGSACEPGNCANTFSYEWDEVGRLAHATRLDNFSGSPAADVRYLYDSSGHRVLRSSQHEGETEPTYNAELFDSLRLEHARWMSDAAEYEHTRDTESVYLAFDGSTYGRVLAHSIDSTAQTYEQNIFLEFADALGSTSSIVDMATGELVEQKTYYPFGAIESEYHSDGWSWFREAFGFSGKEDDTEIGLTYFGARYYSSQIGRWISPDPLTIHAASGDLNPYAYVHGRVMTDTDPIGFDDPSEDGEASGGGPSSSEPDDPSSGDGQSIVEAGPSIPIPGPIIWGPKPIIVDPAPPGTTVVRTWYEGAKENVDAVVSYTSGALFGGLQAAIPGGVWIKPHPSIDNENFRLGQAHGNITVGVPMSIHGGVIAASGVTVETGSGATATVVAVPVVVAGAAISINAMAAVNQGVALLAQRKASSPGAYVRPGGTTARQKALAQGKKCAYCGKTEKKMYADHIDPLVEEHYRNGEVDVVKMRNEKSTQPICPNCSNRQGGYLSGFSKAMKRLFGL